MAVVRMPQARASNGASPRGAAAGGAADAGPTQGPTRAATRPATQGAHVFEGLEPHEVSDNELSKWSEMLDTGICQYIDAHPDRFQRRVRRGIPPRFRWQVWKAKVGVNVSKLSKRYQELCEPSNAWTQQIEIDISRTFPDLRSFDVEPQRKLLRVLNAYAAYNPDVGYCQGMNYVAGLLLIVSDMREEESFAMLARLMDDQNFGLSGLYQERLPLLRRYLRACDRLVAETVPELRDHFIKEQVQPAVYLHQWFLTLFINCFPLSMVMILWDVIVCEGLPVILRIAVSILQVLKDSLLSMQFEEIIKFFKMMKTYDDEGGELNAFRIGQLLIKHTEHVQIPKQTLEYLSRECSEDDGSLDGDESWEADPAGSSWLLQSFTRMFSFGSARRRTPISASSDRGSSAAKWDGAGGRVVSTAAAAALPVAVAVPVPDPVGGGSSWGYQAAGLQPEAAQGEDLSPTWEFL